MTDAHKKMIVRSIRVNKNHIGYIKWLLESHDGMATPTTRESDGEVLDLLVSPDFLDEFDALLEALVDELGIETADLPDDPPLGG